MNVPSRVINMTLGEPALEQLASTVTGDVLRPDDDGFDAAREIWNSRLQRDPAVVLRCTEPADVAAGVRFATDQAIDLGVKSGGHDYAGRSAVDDGLLLNLEPMNAVSIDPATNRATVEAGATWGEFDEAAQDHGLATTGPTVSTVGVAGATLGGGSGHLARSFGLSLDNVVEMEVVTADADVVTVSEEQHADLFWALRGGIGNFGVVTEFEFELHEVGPDVLGGQAMHPIDDAVSVLEFYRDFMAEAPDELTCYAFCIPIPPMEDFPSELHGEPAISLVASYVGPLDRGRDLLREIETFGEPLFASFDPMPYTALQSMFDDGVPKGQRWYSKARYVDGIADGAIETVASYTADLHGPLSMVYFEPLGGAIGRIDPDATAFPHRDFPYSFHILCGWSEPERDEAMIKWTNDFHDAMAAHGVEDVYVNLLGEDEPDRVSAAYAANFERLREIKRTWDSANRFSGTQNIPPA